MRLRLVLRILPLLVVLAAVRHLDAQTPKPVTAGVVDMFKVLNEHPQTKLRMDAVRKEFADGIEKLKTAAAGTKVQDEQLDLLKEGTPEHLEKLKQLSQTKATLELDRKLLLARMNLAAVKVMRELYEESVAVVSEVAKARGLTMVFMTSSAQLGGRNEAEVMNEIASRPVIWSDPEMDITAAVLAALKK